MNKTKIRFSKKEKEMIADSGWILTKNEIFKKVSRLFETLNTEQQNILLASASSFPSEITATLPKISRGENYKDLPWMLLDYPRVFTLENICAIRILFWWGNFFSITLHLSGGYKKKFEKSIISSYPVIAKKKIYCCINTDQWQHHFGRDNYSLIKTIGEKEFGNIITRKPFIKLAKRISFKKWEQLPTVLLSYFNLFTGILKSEV
jgi:hypothetical protein